MDIIELARLLLPTLIVAIGWALILSLGRDKGGSPGGTERARTTSAAPKLAAVKLESSAKGGISGPRAAALSASTPSAFSGPQGAAVKETAGAEPAKGALWSPLACCVARPRLDSGAPDVSPVTASTAASTPPSDGPYSEEACVAAGVPVEVVGLVAALADEVNVRAEEPLSDPTTLWRFLSAREMDLHAATAMYRETINWRARFSIAAVMAQHGEGERYAQDSSRTSADPFSWVWQRRLVGSPAELMQEYCFWGRLSYYAPSDGAPVAVWRIGAADLAGIVREEIFEFLARGFVAHMEDLLQAGRAVSRLRRQIVRARLVVDASGVSLSSLRYAPKFKQLLILGKLHFPEVTASITVVRAPRSFTTVYNAIQPFLTPVMKRKVCILGDDFDAGLREHAGLDRTCLPEFLGGTRADNEVCRARPLPVGVGAKFRASS